MAGIQAVQAGLQALLSSAITGMSYPVDIGFGWPPENRLQDVARGRPGIVSIYNRRLGRDMTRWTPAIWATTVVPAAITSSVSPLLIAPGGLGTITIGGTPSVGDAVSAVLTNYPAAETAGQVAMAASGATASSLASALAAAVNSDATLSGWVSASASGPQVTLAALPGVPPLRLNSYTGNGGTQIREIGRRELQFQIAIWTQTAETRDLISDPIDTAIAAAEIEFGYQLADGTNVRLCYANSYDIEDATLQDVYRRDFLVSAEYPVTTRDALYAVLIPAFGATPSPPAAPF
jgi:hypothetical protein